MESTVWVEVGRVLWVLGVGTSPASCPLHKPRIGRSKMLPYPLDSLGCRRVPKSSVLRVCQPLDGLLWQNVAHTPGELK
jgi:hypothetical protein